MFALERCGIEELNVCGKALGLSAGAMVLAPNYVSSDGEFLERGFGRIRINILIHVHEEGTQWEEAKKQSQKFQIPVLCIPTGGAATVCGRSIQPHLKDALLIDGKDEKILKMDVWSIVVK